MKTRIPAAMFALFLAASLQVDTAWSQEDESDSTGREAAAQDMLPLEVSLLRSLHFSGPDGIDVLVPPGIYLVEQAPNSQLRLSPREGDSFMVLAEQTTHEEQLDGVLALSEETDADEYHVVLMLPGGIAHDAVASYSGIVARGTRRRALNTAQIGRARAKVQRAPVPSVGVVSTTGMKVPATAPDKGVAPWLYVAKDKRGYYVYPQFALPATRDQINTPIDDKKYRRFVRSRASAFRVAGRAVPLVVNDKAIVDVGGSTLDRSNTAALIDLTQSPRLDAMIQKSIGIKRRDAYYVNAFLVNSLAFDFSATQRTGKEKYRYRERILVDVASKDHRSAALWMLEEGKWTKLYDARRARGTLQNTKRELLKLRTGQQPRFLRGYERVALKEQQATGRQMLVFGARKVASLPEIYCDPSGCRDRKSFQMMTGSLNLPVDSAQPVSLHCGRNGCRQAIDVSPSQTSGSSDTDDSSVAPPPSYKSWGNPALFLTWASCNRRCSRTNCLACCAGQFATEQFVISQAATFCHTFSDLCPWCHIGCAVASAVNMIPLHVSFGLCSGNCMSSYQEYGSNPYQCSVTQPESQSPSQPAGFPAGMGCSVDVQCASRRCEPSPSAPVKVCR